MVFTKRKRPLHLTIIGDEKVGKTCLSLASIIDDDFKLLDDIPSVNENQIKMVTIDKRRKIELWDTGNKEAYGILRPLTYPTADCFIICFAINDRISYDNVLKKWVPEVRHYKPKVPIVIVGTKEDLRSTEVDTLTHDDGTSLKEKTNAREYLECSTLTRNGVDEAIKSAAKCALKYRKGKRNKLNCCCFKVK